MKISRKLAALLCFAIFSMGSVVSQCSPDFIYSFLGIPGLWPDPNTGIDDAYTGQFYDETITIVVPQDTTIDLMDFGFPYAFPVKVSVNQFVVTGVNGLPDDMYYECDNTSCTVTNSAAGCMAIKGTPESSAEYTTFYLEILVDIELDLSDYGMGIQTIPFPIPGYELYVAKGYTGINEPDSLSNKISFYPNPASGIVFFDLPEEINQNELDIRIFDMTGNMVIDQVSAKNNMDVSSLSSGIYFCTITYNKGIISGSINIF